MKKKDVELLQYIKDDVLKDICYGRPVCRYASKEFCKRECLVGRSISLVERLLEEAEVRAK